jgi:NADH:ubiquinone oxidoreductase subunit F (NADH-binding)/NADH:ubiquinone oxidoreductase subunit E
MADSMAAREASRRMNGTTNALKPIDPEIATLAGQHGRDPEALLPILQRLQAQHGGVTRESIENVARALSIPAERAYGVTTFYTMLAMPPRPGPIIRVCDGPACWLHGARATRTAMVQVLSASPPREHSWTVERTSCLGLCDRAPAALVDGDACGPLTPDRPTAALEGWRGEAPNYAQPRPGERRVLLAQGGTIDPDSIESARAHGAYRALERALARPPAGVIAEIEAAGLLGRGGAGFPTGRKWGLVAQEARSPKYVVCNADESEPLAFKDRVLIDSHPHQILEGMALAAYAVGARHGFIYIRGEYARQADRLERAIRQAEGRGWLGERIGGTDFSFHVQLHRGAGAYICGQETALLESLEGRRGEPRFRRPFPSSHGYHRLPTVVNNVETLAAVPHILVKGAAWYRSLGHAATPGTKLYTVLGHVARPGLFEAPFGLTLRQIIHDFGGGMQPGSEFHFALAGGAAGTIVPPALLDLAIDYASAAKGVSLGTGAFLICDRSVSPVAVLRELVHFFEIESCGKCTPCRIGTVQARQTLDRILAGKARGDDARVLRRLADLLRAASFCALGQSVAIPIASALTHFGEAFAAADASYPGSQ